MVDLDNTVFDAHTMFLKHFGLKFNPFLVTDYDYSKNHPLLKDEIYELYNTIDFYGNPCFNLSVLRLLFEKFRLGYDIIFISESKIENVHNFKM